MNSNWFGSAGLLEMMKRRSFLKMAPGLPAASPAIQFGALPTGFAGAASAPPRRPLVIAHRGGMALRPENTLAAFRHAVALRVDVLEFDMNVTADDRLVLHHDTAIDAEMCVPAAGTGIRLPFPIRRLTLAQIRELDCGSRRPAKFPTQELAPGERVPTLEQFLEAIGGRNLLLLGETKMSADQSPDFVEPARFASLVDRVLRKYQVRERFILQSGDYRTLDEMRKLDPAIRICPLGARRYKPDYLGVARQHAATHIMLHYHDIADGDVGKLRAAGLQVYSSTADDPASWRRYVDLGFDGILTNDPAGLIAFLSKGV